MDVSRFAAPAAPELAVLPLQTRFMCFMRPGGPQPPPERPALDYSNEVSTMRSMVPDDDFVAIAELRFH